MAQSIRRPLIAGNWKMNLDLKGSRELMRTLLEQLPGPYAGPEIMVAPPFTVLTSVAQLIQGSPVRLAAQDMHWEEQGAYTGEIAASQLKDIGCTAVILGHSERRRYFGESDEIVRKKLDRALSAGLMPIVCIGETLAERESQKTWRVLETQLKGALKGFAPAQLSGLVIAYEPVWAIGTGKTATGAQAQEAHLFVRKTLGKLYGDLAASARILYGGSVTPDNIDALMAEPDLDGALVGGASLKPVSFLRIVQYRAPVRH